MTAATGVSRRTAAPRTAADLGPPLSSGHSGDGSRRAEAERLFLLPSRRTTFVEEDYLQTMVTIKLRWTDEFAGTDEVAGTDGRGFRNGRTSFPDGRVTDLIGND